LNGCHRRPCRTRAGSDRIAASPGNDAARPVIDNEQLIDDERLIDDEQSKRLKPLFK
jgi:hypothetical protein